MPTKNTPSAILRGSAFVRAQHAPPAANMETVVAAFEQFRERHEARYDKIEASLDDYALKLEAAKIGGAGEGFAVEDPIYSEAFAEFFRKGEANATATVAEANTIGRRGQIQSAMSVGDNSSGGYLAPVEWDRRIQQAQRAKSPMRRLANVQSTSAGAYSTLWSDSVWGSGWVGETASRPSTGSPTLQPLVFATGEIYANVAATQRLLDDASINVDAWLTGQIEDEFSRQEDLAFITGNGTNKPFGLLQYVTGGAAASQHPGGVLDTVVSGHATLLGTDTAAAIDKLIDFMYGLAAPYRANATWLMNSLTAATIAKFKNADGDLIWRESAITGQPSTLLGRPVEFDENMPNVGAGNLPIAFGDFRAGYVVNDWVGTRILRDPFTNKPFVQFYVTKRVGGGVSDPRAIRLLKIAAS